MNYVFMNKEINRITLKINGFPRDYSVKAIFPFDSVRKMMSSVIKTSEGEYIMYTKGADSSMLHKLDLVESELTKIHA